MDALVVRVIDTLGALETSARGCAGLAVGSLALGVWVGRGDLARVAWALGTAWALAAAYLGSHP